MRASNGVEQVTIDAVGGPYPGKRIVPLTSVCEAWPLPEEIAAEGGKYVRVSISSLPESAADSPNVVRGAKYKFREITEDEQIDAVAATEEIVVRYLKGPTLPMSAVADFVRGHLRTRDATFSVSIQKSSKIADKLAAVRHAVGGADGIKNCLSHGNDAPLDILFAEIEEVISELRGCQGAKW